MQYFLLQDSQPLFARSDVDLEHAIHVISDFLEQAHKADHKVECDCTKAKQPVNSSPALSATTETTEVEITENLKEESGSTTDMSQTDGNTQESGERRNDGEGNAGEEDSDIVIDPFKWLLPTKFQ
jgi:hypothetical protein